MKNSNKIITDDIKVSEIVDNLVAEGQEEFISGDENQVTFEVDESSKELMDLIAEQEHQAELQGEEGSSFDTFITGDESSFAQTVLEQNQQDVDEPTSLPVDTDTSSSITDTLSGSTLGGGGLSHLSAAPFSNPLSGEALPGETTASSTVSGIQGISPNDGSATVDGLSGIGFDRQEFGFPPLQPVEVARVDNTLAVEATPSPVGVEEVCEVVAENDMFDININGPTNGSGYEFSVSFNYREILSNDLGTDIFVKEFEGAEVPSGMTSNPFSFSDGNVSISSGRVSEGGVSFDGSTMSIEEKFFLNYQIGNGECCDSATIEFSFVMGEPG